MPGVGQISLPTLPPTALAPRHLPLTKLHRFFWSVLSTGGTSSQAVCQASEFRFLGSVTCHPLESVPLLMSPQWHLQSSQGRGKEGNLHTELASHPGGEDEWSSQLSSGVEYLLVYLRVIVALSGPGPSFPQAGGKTSCS